MTIPRAAVGASLEPQVTSNVNDFEHSSQPSNDSPHDRRRLGHSSVCGLHAMQLAWSPLRLEAHHYYSLDCRLPLTLPTRPDQEGERPRRADADAASHQARQLSDLHFQWLGLVQQCNRHSSSSRRLPFGGGT